MTFSDLSRLSLLLATACFLSACSMQEEMKRIDAANEARQLREQSRSTNLTGEQLFIRSCNSCHPGGKAGVGPSLEELNEHFPKDEDLKKLLRKGSKNMPAQPEATINPTELDNLVVYLHELVNRLNEDKKK